MANFMASRPSQFSRTYPGGKGKRYQQIINLMPPHEIYVESHLGGGAVMLKKRPAMTNIGIELDAQVCAKWRQQHERSFDLVQGDALDVLTDLNLPSSALVYCDPPYLPSTRRQTRVYRHDYDEADHRRLLTTLKRLACRVILSGYASALYAEQLAGWEVRQMEVQTQQGSTTELLWTNYNPGAVLHDYAHIGADFREREALRRRLRTIVRRLALAGEQERRAALALLSQCYPTEFRDAAKMMP